MTELRYTLVSDGSSDKALLPIITWLLIQNGISCAIQPYWAEIRNFPIPAKKLINRIKMSYDFYPCDILFIHRDAERETIEHRVNEIKNAMKNISIHLPPYICVIPVKMTEAWLLIDEKAIRIAAGNRNGTEILEIPKLHELESLPDPKKILYELLKKASGLSGRRRKRFQVYRYAPRISEFISDFSPLRGLTAFSYLETEIRKFIITRTFNSID